MLLGTYSEDQPNLIASFSSFFLSFFISLGLSFFGNLKVGLFKADVLM